MKRIDNEFLVNSSAYIPHSNDINRKSFLKTFLVLLAKYVFDVSLYD